jgi:hypothetical protein
MAAQTVDIPKKWPLINQFNNRAETLDKDARLINCIVEKDPNDGEYWIQRRVGLSTAVQTLSGEGYGMFMYESLTQYTDPLTFKVYKLLNAIPIKIAALNSSVVNVYNGSTIIGTAQLSSMISFQPMPFGANTTLVFGANNAVYYTDGSFGSVTKITDANFPLQVVPGFVYLDGTLYVMTIDGSIYGSKNLDDPTVWDPLNLIKANQYSDHAVCLARQLSYVLAIKSTTTEFFYDGGNATGSPLTKLPGGLLNFGSVSADSVKEIDGLLFWLTSNNTVSPQVVKLDNLLPTFVSTPGVERLLDGVTSSTTIRAFAFKHGGHRYYVLTLIELNLTLVFDIDQNTWYQWTDANGNYWPIVSQSYDLTNNHIFQHKSNGQVFRMEGDYIYPNDAGALIPVDIYTPNYTGGVRRRKKQLKSMGFEADQVTGSILQVRSSDDDYQTWSNFRQVDLSKETPELIDEGSFYRRAYHFRHQSNTAFRIKAVDLQIDLGTN